MKRIKVFLGGFTNYTNAQNLNCRALALHLDKTKFEVFTLELYSGSLPTLSRLNGIKIFNCFRPARVSLYLGFLWGIWNCDVAYLPKSELWRFNRFILKLFNKKSFKTIEGILDKDNMDSAIRIIGSYKSVLNEKTYVDKSFAITHFLGEYNKKHHQINVEPVPLYLGCQIADFINEQPKSGILKEVVYIGRLKKRKGIYDFLTIADHFPELEFYIFGDGEEREVIDNYLRDNKLFNVKLMGLVDHKTLSHFLKEIDLHILPSRSEGFPKVTLETAAAGVPSIVYDDYGADEWITDGVNGWVVKDIAKMITLIEGLQGNPLKLKEISSGAIKLAKSFDWEIKIKDWEAEILVLFNT
jgi:glycosyltransferase involved in cell wall biosynthesis